MLRERDKANPVRLSLRYMLVSSALAPLTIWALVREHWFVFWCGLAVLLISTYLVLPMTSQSNDGGRWKFGPRDVLFWLIVIALTQAWWADHRRLKHLANEQRQLYGHDIENLRRSLENQNRSADQMRPPSIYRSSKLYFELKCDRCGTRVGDKSPDDLWYAWQGLSDDVQPRKPKKLCNECAAHFDVMGQDQTTLTFEKKWRAEVSDVDSTVPPLTPATTEPAD